MLWTLFALVAAALVAGIVFRESLAAVYVIVTDGVLAGLVVAAATGLGLWLVAALRLGDAPLRWQLLLAAGLGIGALMLLVLAAGLLGLLQRGLWIGLLLAAFAAGGVRVTALYKRRRAVPRESRCRLQPIHWLWLLAMPALAMTLLVAAVPPGFLWVEEAGGYDALEYHLGAPKEHWQAGRIEYLPHNVYANFPFNVEMLYLLAMVVKGDFRSAVYLANMLNAALAMLTVAALWLAGREFSPAAGVVAGVVGATTGWLTYLSGVCFVENGMLFFGALSVACWCRTVAGARDDISPSWPWALCAGLLAGLSCGCKYTAAAMFAAPLALIWALRPSCRPGERARSLGLFAAGTLITFGPWLAKNAIMTGNPVFPLAYGIFGAHDTVWDDRLDDRWTAGHQPAPNERTVSARLGAAWGRILAEPRFSILPGAVFVLALVALAGRARWAAIALLGVLVMQLGVWALATHLYARFAVPLIVPVAVLVGLAATAFPARAARAAVVGAVVVVSASNLYPTWRRYYDHLHLVRFGAPTPTAVPYDAVENIVDSWVNAHVPDEAYVLLVGDAAAFYVKCRVVYCVVFNRNPFADAIRAAGDDDRAVVDWLRERGYTHVAVQWSEMARFRRTYGFWPELDRDRFARLEKAGLKVARALRRGEDAPPFATVYEVPRE